MPSERAVKTLGSRRDVDSMKNWIVLGVALALTLASTVSPHAQEKRIALVIGNGEYQYSPRLKNTVNDANDTAAALTKAGFKVVALTNADRVTMEKAVRDFGNLPREPRGGGAVLLFRAWSFNPKATTTLSRSTPDIQDADEIRYKCVDAESVLAKMRSARNKLNLIILDACRNNPISPGQAALRTRACPLSRPSAGIRHHLCNRSRRHRGRRAPGRNSPFTAAFLGVIETPGQDSLSMMKRVTASV